MARSCIVFFWAISLLHTGAAAQEVADPSLEKSPPPMQLLRECKAALQRSVTALQNVDIGFTVEVDWRIPNLPRMTGESGHIYLEGGKAYYRFERTFPPLPGRPHVVELEEIAYDGHTYYLGKNSKGGSPSIKTMLGDNPDSPYAWQHVTKTCLYLEAAGYRLPRKVAQWEEGATLTSIVLDYLQAGDVNHIEIIDEGGASLLAVSVTIPDPVVFDAQTMDLDLIAKEMRQNGSSRAEIEERIDKLLQLRNSGRKRRVDLWLWPDKDYSLVRRVESTLDGKKIYEVEAADFKTFGKASVWLPRNGTIKTFVRNARLATDFLSEPNRTDLIHLDRVSFQPRDDIPFKLNYGPRTFIVDRSSEAARSSPSGEINYIEPASLDELREAANAQRPRSSWRWLLVANVILVVLLLVGLAIYRFRS